MIILALIAVWLAFAARALLLVSTGLSDFSVFYSAAATLSDHSGSIYNLSAIVATAQRHNACELYPHPAYLYPPLLATLLMPLVAFPCGTAIHVWIALQLILWAGSAALIVLWLHRLWTPEPIATAVGLAFAVLSWPLASGLVQFAQVDALVLFCMLLAPWLIAHGHPKLGGGVLAFAAMIKVIPVLLIGYYVLRGRWRVAAGALICGATLGMCQALVVGLPEMFAMGAILTNSSVFVAQADNFSLLHMPVWIALAVGVHIPPSTSALGGILVGVVALLFGVTILGSRGWRTSLVQYELDQPHIVRAASTEQLDLLGYAWASGVMLLLTPLVWLHYLAWLLVPLTLCGGYLLGRWRGQGQSILLGLLVIGYVFATVRLPLNYDTTPEYALGPYLGVYGLRPLLMVTHPLGELIVVLVAGIIFVHAAGMMPRRRACKADAAALVVVGPHGDISSNV